MNIRPKNEILFALTGVKFTLNNLGGANWRQQVFNNYRQHLLDLLAKYGLDDGYAYWLNDMQSRHSKLYNSANANGDWLKTAYKNEDVGKYLHDYKGDLRFGTYNPRNEDRADFNQLGIVKALELNRYDISGPIRTSGDYGNHDFKVDNLYSAITDDRRLLGRKGDWDENSQEFKDWLRDLNSKGWETYLDTSDNYYKLRRINNPSLNNPPSNTSQLELNNTNSRGINPTETKDKESLWSKLGAGLKNVAPDLLDALRLAGNMHNNDRVYNESMKAIRPNLQQSYHTYRLVVGDEATKLAYYRRAVQGQTKAGQPFTADADRLVAYMNEAKRIGDELRAQGDLADNLRIRETSAESAAHADANRERDTTVANNNATEILKAIAAKHQLTAQKYSADWTNIDLFLLGKLAKLEQEKARLKAIEDQIKTLQMQDDLANNLFIKNAQTQLENKAKELFPNGDINWNDSRLNDAIKNLLSVRRKELIKLYKIYSAKSGTKLTYSDNTDKYLYRTSRDIVEHFRRMSKMTDDSRTRTLPKPIKLSSHPKKRKYLLGGVAPFTIYRPLGVGGESAISTQTSDTGSSKSSKDTAAKDKLDMIKELFKSVQGLPIDASKVYSQISGLLSKYKAFGEEMSTDDIASMYLSAMNQINHLKYSQDAYNKAHAVAVANDSLDEIAVGVNGEMALLNAEGEVTLGTYAKWKESEGKLNPLTNGQLLTMRAHSPNLAFNDEVFDIVNNGVGMTKIALTIKSMAASLGSSTEKLEGISLVESNKVKAGLQILAGIDGTPDGYYQVTLSNKNSKEQVNAALNYIYNMLPKNYKTILALHSGSELNSLTLIYNFLSSLTNPSIELTIAPLTGKASDKDNSKEGSEGLKLDAATALVTGKGYKAEIELNPGSNYAIKTLGRFSEFQKKSGENMGAGTTMLEATESTIKGNLDWNKATIGGSRIIPTAYNQIILNNGEVAGIDLPVDPSNPDIPNFEMLKQLENLDKLLKLNNIEDSELNWKKVNEICDKIGIPHKYDSTGKFNLTLWKRFAAFLVTTPDTALVNKNVILDMVGIASKEERDLYNNFILNKTNNKNFELSDTFLGFGHRDELYKGTVFVPIKESIVASAISGGLNIYMNLATDLELREQGYDPSKVKSYKKSEYSL